MSFVQCLQGTICHTANSFIVRNLLTTIMLFHLFVPLPEVMLHFLHASNCHCQMSVSESMWNAWGLFIHTVGIKQNNDLLISQRIRDSTEVALSLCISFTMTCQYFFRGIYSKSVGNAKYRNCDNTE